MRKLILVKHSLPQITPELPASQWRLSDVGHSRCKALAAQLEAHSPDVIVASAEPKAIETAQIVANLLDKPFEIVDGLQEHDRSNIGFLSKEAFEAAISDLFARPDKLVMGRETAEQARERFKQAIVQVIERHTPSSIAVIAHGTVISLFVAEVTGMEPFALWKRLSLPSFVVLTLPQFSLGEIIEEIR